MQCNELWQLVKVFVKINTIWYALYVQYIVAKAHIPVATKKWVECVGCCVFILLLSSFLFC